MADRVLITGARSAAALDLARDFRAAGWEPHLADCSASRIARWSSACVGFHHYPSPVFDGPGFRARILALVNEIDPRLIVPTCEEVFHLSAPSLAERLSDRLFAPPHDLLQCLHDKLVFARACADWGLAAPESIAIDDSSALRDFGELQDWVFKPRFSRFGESALIGPSRRALEGVAIDRPWLAQRRVRGEEASFSAVSHGGRLTAFAAYRSDWRMRGGASYAFQPLPPALAERVLKLAAGLAEAVGLTAQFSCDVIFDDGGQPWLIECNPRATSGVHLLAGDGGLARAIVGDGTGLLQQQPRPAHLGPAMVFFGLPAALRSRSIAAWRRARAEGRDVLSRPGDCMPLLGAIVDSVSFSLDGLRHGISTSAATTRNIEWNGEPLP